MSIGLAGSEDDAYCWWREERLIKEACGFKLSHYQEFDSGLL
jgi:hypothetical protein